MAEWMPRERWDALVRGDSCPLCAVIASREEEGSEGFHISDLSASKLFPARNQYIAGYSVLVCNQHVREPYHLEADGQELLFMDLMAASAAIDAALKRSR